MRPWAGRNKTAGFRECEAPSNVSWFVSPPPLEWLAMHRDMRLRGEVLLGTRSAPRLPRPTLPWLLWTEFFLYRERLFSVIMHSWGRIQ